MKFLSSDVKDTNPIDVQGWITAIRSGPHAVGQIHFEHYDRCLNVWATAGNPILNGIADFPTGTDCTGLPHMPIDSLEMLRWIRDFSGASESATRLLQNGTVNTESSSLRRLRWREVINTTSVDNDPKRLVGYGFMGALAAGDARLTIGPYFRDLRAHNVNFTRVWAVESWTGQASSSSEGPTPFAGTFAGDYNLDQDNPIFYDRLRRFAQEAADRGIVVQLSLFDKHGLICPANPGAYFHSPYKDANNVPEQDFMDDTWQNCSCTSLSGDEGPGNLLSQNCHPLRMFLGQGNTTKELALRAIHARYLRRVGEEVGGVGNMIFEVINEALEPLGGNPGDWPEAFGTSTRNQVWQKSIVNDMRLSLPIDSANGVHIARDAFNGETTSPQPLNGRASDGSTATWSAGNAIIWQESVESDPDPNSLGPDRIFGYVTAYGTPNPYSEGSLPFGAGSSMWTKLQVRGDITCNQGVIKLGTKAVDGTKTYVIVDCGGSGSEWTATTIRVAQEPPSGPGTTLAVVGQWAPGQEHNVRFLVKKSGTGALTGFVYLDGILIGKEIAIPATDFARAFFWASDRETGTYPPNLFKLDNFEAARFCDQAGCPVGP
jgi:hypothetical protein